MIEAARDAFMVGAGLPTKFPMSARNCLTEDRARSCNYHFDEFRMMVADMKRAPHLMNPFAVDDQGERLLRSTDEVQVLEDFQIGMPEGCVEGLSLEDACRVHVRYYELMGKLLEGARLSRYVAPDDEPAAPEPQPKRARVAAPEPDPASAAPEPEGLEPEGSEPEGSEYGDADSNITEGPDSEHEGPRVRAPLAAAVPAGPAAPQWLPLGLKGKCRAEVKEHTERMLAHIKSIPDFLSRFCVASISDRASTPKAPFKEIFFDVTHYKAIPDEVTAAFTRAGNEIGLVAKKGHFHHHWLWEFPGKGRQPIVVIME